MRNFTVSLFGHRRIDDLRQLQNRLSQTIKMLMREKNYVTFFIGRNGEFDEYAASVIKQVQKECGNENSEIILVLPYKVADLTYYEKYYDHVMIWEDVHVFHPKAAITWRNRWMVEQSDLVIGYVERNHGGAFSALKYAEKKKVHWINLCQPFDFDTV